jgi:hypothetical protein
MGQRKETDSINSTLQLGKLCGHIENQAAGTHFLFFILFYLCGIGVDQSFELAQQELYCLSNTSSPFYSGYFGDGVLLCT